MSFHIGQKVVCVNDVGEPHPLWPLDFWSIEKGQIYTLRWLGHDEDGPLCMLEEVDRGLLDGIDAPFDLRRFRAVQERPDSIELFREIARGVSNGKPIIEDAEYRPQPVPITTPAGPLVVITKEGWFYP